ncbi:hypothetical protein [Microbulbifer sp. SSSA005]|uniref:hypothetical protein n=1 Tax=Microbulbifer sp. SSSA005 TaxID=3243378 RepID=UPI00403A5E4F
MKLHKQISVGGEIYKLVDSNIRLNLFTPGRAVFSLQSSEPISGLTIFSCGYDAGSLSPWFVGFVESSTTVNTQQQRIFCRELSAVLYYRLPIALRNVGLEETLHKIGELSGLEFSLPQGEFEYLKNRTAAFYNTGNGFHAMDSLASVFNIPKLLWQLQAGGDLFVGSWDHSYWADKPVQIDRSWERQLTSHNGATLPALPALRPGALYNGDILTGVELAGTQMNITWSANPWAER